jgi:hypothetical protein
MQGDFNAAREAEQRLAADRRHAEEMQLHRAKVGSVKRPIAWRKLRERIQGVIGVDRALFVARPNVVSKMTVAADGNSFVLDRAAYPKARTRAVFQNPLIQLQCLYQKTDDSDAVEWEDEIELQLDELDRVLLQHRGEIISEDDTALIILAPTRDPTFTPKGRT